MPENGSRTKYRCVKFCTSLTVGAIYTEIHPIGNELNACVYNDEGEPQYVDKRKHLELLEDL